MKKKYQSGGSVKPNYQTLGKIIFDSNEAKDTGKGYLIVKDKKTGKDFGVQRNANGTYRYYNEKNPYKPERDYIENWFSSPVTKSRYEKSGGIGGYSDELDIQDAIASAKTPILTPTDSVEVRKRSGNKQIADYELRRLLAHQTSGVHLRGNKSTGVIVVDPSSKDLDSTIPHELSHNKYMDENIGQFILDNFSTLNHPMSEYLKKNRAEIHPRIMEMRYHMGVKPGQQVKEVPDAIIKKAQLDGVYDKDTLLEILNTVAQSNSSDTTYASNGGTINMKNKYKHYKTGGPTEDGSNFAEGLGSALGIINPLIGIGGAVLPSLAKLISPREPVVLSASPGNYQSGGPVDPMITNPMQRANTYVAPYILPRAIANDSIWNPMIAPAPSTKLYDSSLGLQSPLGQRHVGFESSGKSKSKDRFHERANGGDVPLSSFAFQVNGDPSKVDSETYQMGQQMVKLDDNEVYKQGAQGGYVFSNRLKEGKTSYADMAKTHERKIGKAEKKVSRNPQDEFSQNTIEQSNRVLATLAGKQELKAQSMGLREPLQDARDGKIPSKQSGGPLDWMRYTEGRQQETPVSTVPTDELLNVLQESIGYGLQDTTRYNELSRRSAQDPNIPYALANIGANTPRPPYASGQFPVSQVPTPKLQGVFNNENQYGVYDKVRGDELAKRNGKTPTGTRRPKTDAPFDTKKFYEQYPGAAPYQGKDLVFDPLRNPYMPFDQLSNTREPKSPLAPAGERIASSSNNRGAEAMKSVKGMFPSLFENKGQVTNDTGEEYKTPYTFGDALQTITAVSKFGQLLGGPEKQRPYTNNTPITQRTYDPSNALYQNQRQFTNTYNQLSNTPSLNATRAIASNLYAQNLNQGNNILSKYDQMNQEARSSYQSQLGARRAENIRYNMTTDDINARNRGAYSTAIDNAFNSLGNLGQNFNQKAYSDASIALLRDTYKDVFPRFQQILQQQGLFQ